MNKILNPPRKKNLAGFEPQESIISIAPPVIAGVILLFGLLPLFNEFTSAEYQKGMFFEVFFWLIGIGCFYLFFIQLFYTRSISKFWFAWVNALISLIYLMFLTRILPPRLDVYLFSMMTASAIISAIISGRWPAYFLAVAYYFLHGFISSRDLDPSMMVLHASLTFIALMGAETVHQLKAMAEKQVERLELINEFSRQISSSLEFEQVLHLLNATFQNTIEADTYYLGILDGDEIVLRLFYDDGEYFNGMRVNIKGALSGWVIKHQSELFLPDLRNPLNLEGVDVVVVGQDKTSLSWMGVPLIGSYVKGIMAIASYSPNAFTRNDMELLVAIAQRAAHALDNAYHHASVKEQARLDSLTGVLNHGSFIQALARHAEDAVAMKLPLALIMIDIDHFKKYNDTYGHQLGDDVLINLCKVIRANIKKTDEVGRWGGEEFGVILPNTNAEQVLQIAQRIRTALAQVTLSNDTHKNIPAPTVSQGVALLPYETDNTHILIDLADKRLFIAKDRGRDQIEFPLIDSIVKP